MPFAMTAGGALYYLACDQVGSLRIVADTSGNAVKRIDYDSFGNVISDSAPNFSVPFGFAGGLYDKDTKLVRFGYRDYDPDTGRWTAKDPIGFAGGDTDLYGYCVNDPVNLVDPEGNFFFLVAAPAAYTGLMALADATIAIAMGYTANAALMNSGNKPDLSILGNAVITGGSSPSEPEDPQNKKKQKCEFKSSQQRKQLEGYKNLLKRQLKGDQLDAFKRIIENGKLGGEQFSTKEAIDEAFQYVSKNIKP